MQHASLFIAVGFIGISLTLLAENRQVRKVTQTGKKMYAIL